jgi:outer membrane protein assembly factor BamB
VANLHVIERSGKPALAWWEGTINGGIGAGDVVLADSTYREISRIHAGNGRRADLHEFQLTAQGTALLLADAGVAATDAPGGTGLAGQVIDCAVQEIDLQTGAVRFEWHTITDIAIDESYVDPPANPTASIYDYVHANSIEVDHDGTLLVSARNTSTVYKIDRTTGAIVWRLGGKQSDFAMGTGATFSWQHDARRQADGTLTIFDDGASPGHSRGIVLRLDEQAKTATLVRAFEHPAPLLARSQGNMQVLPGGNVLIGWGDAGYVSEFSANGKIVFDATYPAAVQSYRNYRQAWTGRPADLPAAAAVSGPGGSVTAFASWNGATEVATWDVLAGPSAGALKLAGSVPRSGFETSIPVRGPAQWVQVVARNARGAVLGSSPIVNVSA